MKSKGSRLSKQIEDFNYWVDLEKEDFYYHTPTKKGRYSRTKEEIDVFNIVPDEDCDVIIADVESTGDAGPNESTINDVLDEFDVPKRKRGPKSAKEKIPEFKKLFTNHKPTQLALCKVLQDEKILPSSPSPLILTPEQQDKLRQFSGDFFERLDLSQDKIKNVLIPAMNNLQDELSVDLGVTTFSRYIRNLKKTKLDLIEKFGLNSREHPFSVTVDGVTAIHLTHLVYFNPVRYMTSLFEFSWMRELYPTFRSGKLLALL